MMKKKQFIVLGTLFILSLALFLGVKVWNKNQTAKEEAQTEAEKENLVIHQMDKSTIHQITYEYENEKIELVKEEDGWKYVGDKERTIDTSDVNDMLSRFASVEARTILSDVTDLEQYGLAQGYREIVCQTTEGESFCYFLGDQNGITGNYYIMLPEDPTRVYAVSNLYANSFSKSLEDITVVEEEDAEEVTE